MPPIKIIPATTVLNPNTTIPKNIKQTATITSDIRNAQNAELTVEIKCSNKVLELSKAGFTIKPGTTTVLTGTQSVNASDTKLVIDKLGIKNNNTGGTASANITVTIIHNDVKSFGSATQNYD